MHSTSASSIPAEEILHRWNPNNQHEGIAVRAYFKAESRGFAPGHALDDWLEAEKEILREEWHAHVPDEE